MCYNTISMKSNLFVFIGLSAVLAVNLYFRAFPIYFPQLKALAVFRSGESLTGSRMGVAAVNTLAWLANIPIIEIDEIGFEAGLKSLTRDELSLSVVKQTLPLS